MLGDDGPLLRPVLRNERQQHHGPKSSSSVGSTMVFLSDAEVRSHHVPMLPPFDDRQ